MRQRGAASRWIACVMVVGIVASLAGCASTGSSTVVPVTDVKSLAGKWAGVAEGPGSTQQDYVEMIIKEDGTYTVTTSRTMGRFQGTGRITVAGGGLTLKGDNTSGAASLMSSGSGDRVLKVDVNMATPGGGVPSNVSANLRPAR